MRDLLLLRGTSFLPGRRRFWWSSNKVCREKRVKTRRHSQLESIMNRFTSENPVLAEGLLMSGGPLELTSKSVRPISGASGV